MATPFRNIGSIESSDALASMNGTGAFMDYDSANGYARFGSKGGVGVSLGTRIATVLNGVLQNAITIAANALTITLLAGSTLAAQAVTATSLVATGRIDANGGVRVTTNVAADAAGGFTYNTVDGVRTWGKNGTTYAWTVLNDAGSYVMRVPISTQNVQMQGTLTVAAGLTVTAGGMAVSAGASTVQALTVNGSFSQSLNLAGNVVASFINTNTSTPNGMVVAIGGTPNNNSQFFWSSADGAGSGTARAIIFSNGGISNYSANNVNLSDARTKKPGWTPLAYDFDRFERISIVRYQYKDQTHTDDNFGVIADELEAVDPHFVDEFAFGPKKAMRKMVYEHDLFYAHMDITQQLQRRVKALEAHLAARN